MDLPIKINSFRFESSIIYFKGTWVEISNCAVLQSLKIVLILENSIDPDEMASSVAFYLGLHTFSKYPFIGIRRLKSTRLRIKYVNSLLSLHWLVSSADNLCKRFRHRARPKKCHA